LTEPTVRRATELLRTAQFKKPSDSTARRDRRGARPRPREEGIQFSVSLRKGLRKQRARLADDANMTMRAFVLDALKDKGLDVRSDDLVDLRKERR
jgi:hypothetical protein